MSHGFHCMFRKLTCRSHGSSWWNFVACAFHIAFAGVFAFSRVRLGSQRGGEREIQVGGLELRLVEFGWLGGSLGKSEIPAVLDE